MKAKAILMFIYGLLLLVGGFIGHLKAGSNASLIAGTICGIAAVGSGFAMLRNWSLGLVSGILLTTLLTGFFTYRFFLSYAFMPSGMMAVISVLMVGLLIFGKKKIIVA